MRVGLFSRLLKSNPLRQAILDAMSSWLVGENCSPEFIAPFVERYSQPGLRQGIVDAEITDEDTLHALTSKTCLLKRKCPVSEGDTSLTGRGDFKPDGPRACIGIDRACPRAGGRRAF